MRFLQVTEMLAIRKCQKCTKIIAAAVERVKNIIYVLIIIFLFIFKFKLFLTDVFPRYGQRYEFKIRLRGLLYVGVNINIVTHGIATNVYIYLHMPNNLIINYARLH